MLFLGVDIGTSTIKATVLNELGDIMTSYKSKVRVLNPQPGFYEVDPIASWWRGFVDILRKISEDVDLSEIISICLSSVCGSFVPVNDYFDPLYNAILYGIDKRSSSLVSKLNDRFSENYLTSKLGSSFTTHSVLPKILWLKKNARNVYERTKFFVESVNFITGKLTGQAAWDLPTAAGCQLIDLHRLHYPVEILESMDLDINKFPKLIWPLQPLGVVTEKAAKETGLKKGTMVLAGACDINAEAVSCEAINPGDLLVVLGSTVSILLTLKKLKIKKGFVSGVSIIPGQYRLGGATSSGGRFVNQMTKLIASIAEFPPYETKLFPTGLIMLPYLDGARCPYHNPNALGTIYGLSSNTSPTDLYLAVRESLGFELAVILRKLEEYLKQSKTIYVTGGLSKDRLLLQVMSNITGMIIKTYPNVDASFGDAVMAMTAYMPLEKALEIRFSCSQVESGASIFPDEKLHDIYAHFVRKYEALYEALLGVFESSGRFNHTNDACD